MEAEFNIPQEKKEEVRGWVDEIDEMLEMATAELEKDDRQAALNHLVNTSSACEEMDVIFSDAEGYEEVKDFWRSGIQGAKEGRFEEAIEDIRNYLEYFR